MTTKTALEYQITGPPGTGKTFALTKHAKAAVDKHGPAGVVLTSLTKAAAMEIATRDTGVLSENVGTLHSLCYRSRRPTVLLDTPKGVKLWNQHCQDIGKPSWQLSGGDRDPDDPLSDPGEDQTLGDELLERISSLRHRMVKLDLWDPALIPFTEAWYRFADDVDGTDFTGLIMHGLDMDTAPSAPNVLIGDEAQDWTKLEATVFRRWSERADVSILAADPDQTLYEWRDASPRIFLDYPVPDAHRRLLGQSYRVPRAVHALAQTIIRRIADRTDVAYLPRDDEGSVTYREDGRWKRPDLWLDDLLATVGTTMVIAPCSYHLQPLLAMLRREGIPFANPYRLKRGDWNPLQVGGNKKTAANQLAAYLAGNADGWATDELARWIPLLRSTADGDHAAVLARGARVGLGRMSGPYPTAEEYYGLFREPADAHSALTRDVTWLLAKATSKDASRLDYPAAVFRRGGKQALVQPPRLQVGTIHSFKGAEADHVFVLTALPTRWAERPDADELHRLFYVAVTRARKSVTMLCGDRGGYQP